MRRLPSVCLPQIAARFIAWQAFLFCLIPFKAPPHSRSYFILKARNAPAAKASGMFRAAKARASPAPDEAPAAPKPLRLSAHKKKCRSLVRRISCQKETAPQCKSFCLSAPEETPQRRSSASSVFPAKRTFCRAVRGSLPGAIAAANAAHTRPASSCRAPYTPRPKKPVQKHLAQPCRLCRQQSRPKRQLCPVLLFTAVRLPRFQAALRRKAACQTLLRRLSAQAADLRPPVPCANRFRYTDEIRSMPQEQPMRFCFLPLLL